MRTSFLILAALATIASSNIIKPTLLTEELINLINEKQSTWVAGRNFAEDTPIEHLYNLNGAELGSPVDKSEMRANILEIEDLPENFDAREQWPQCRSIQEIRNQGGCGSCWAFASVETMTDRYCIATNGEYFEFSPENLLSCCTECSMGCKGGWFSKAFDYWKSTGIVSGGDYNSYVGCQPYSQLPFQNGEVAQCEEKCTNAGYEISYSQDKHFAVETYRYSQDVEAIQAEIYKNGPVTAYFKVYEDFYSYKSGVYQYTTGNFSGGHAIKIIGWGVESDTPYWLAANSWGPSWGDLDGFFKILRGSNHCEIESEISAGDPQI